MQYQHINVPDSGEHIHIDEHGQWHIPDQPIIAYIDGDGVGLDVMPVMRQVVDAAIEHRYGKRRKIHWMQVYNGEQAAKLYDGDWFPQETINAVRECKIAIKGPLTTPLGGGFRSLNVALRHEMDLFVNMRTIKGFSALPTPLKTLLPLILLCCAIAVKTYIQELNGRRGVLKVKKCSIFCVKKWG